MFEKCKEMYVDPDNFLIELFKQCKFRDNTKRRKQTFSSGIYA